MVLHSRESMSSPTLFKPGGFHRAFFIALFCTFAMMQSPPVILLSLLFALLPGWLKAQMQDTAACTPEKPCKAFVISNLNTEIPDTIPVDTGIVRFHQVPVFNGSAFFPALTGPTGRPATNLFIRFDPELTGNIFRNPYRNYQLNTGNLELIRSETPYSEWYYLIGANREQIFRAIHAQDAGKGLNFGLDVKFINALGAYRHEHAKTNYIGLYAQYRNQKIPLQSQLFFFSNGITHEENAGIADPSYFEDTAKINRQLAPIWLSYATNTHRSTEVILINELKFNRLQINLKRKTDTIAVPDSVSSPLHQSLALDIRARREWFIYRDADPFNPWYTLTRYDTTVTFDSLSFSTLLADLSYKASFKHWAQLKTGIRVQGYRYFDTLNPEGTGSAWSPYARLELRLLKHIRVQADAALWSDAAFGERHEVSAGIHWLSTDKWEAGFQAGSWSAYPYRQDMTYASNHFVWNQSMTNTRYLQGKAYLQHRGNYPVDLSLSATGITNIIYYNQQALPNQYPGDIWLLQLLASTSGEAGLLVYEGKVGIQKSLDDASIIRVPLLLGEAMAGLRFRLFKGKISAIGGVVVHARTAAYTDQWMPATRVFYHTTLYETGGYVWADPFITFVLKKTRFMLKYEHASAWLAGFGQYSVPGYPMKDPAIIFAVSWRFMD